MNFSSRFASLVLLALLFTTGCGKSLVPVQGKVSVNGQPLTTGNLTFYPGDLKEASIAYATIGADGTYKVNEGTTGIVAGKYKVTVTAGVPSNPADPYSLPVSLVNPQFSDLATTPLSIDVAPGAAGPFDLEVTK